MPINMIDLIVWRSVLNLSLGGSCGRKFGNTIITIGYEYFKYL
jgi:hypothetical protein